MRRALPFYLAALAVLAAGVALAVVAVHGHGVGCPQPGPPQPCDPLRWDHEYGLRAAIIFGATVLAGLLAWEGSRIRVPWPKE